MAKIKVVVTTCDRHGGEIKKHEQFFHLDIAAGPRSPGRTAHRIIDLCAECSADFLKFLEGDEHDEASEDMG